MSITPKPTAQVWTITPSRRKQQHVIHYLFSLYYEERENTQLTMYYERALEFLESNADWIEAFNAFILSQSGIVGLR
jgi:hypothetical protein